MLWNKQIKIFTLSIYIHILLFLEALMSRYNSASNVDHKMKIISTYQGIARSHKDWPHNPGNSAESTCKVQWALYKY